MRLRNVTFKRFMIRKNTLYDFGLMEASPVNLGDMIQKNMLLLP